MKFINYLETITGISIYPLVTLMIFVPFFVLIVLYVLGTNREKWNKMGEMPLDNES